MTRFLCTGSLAECLLKGEVTYKILRSQLSVPVGIHRNGVHFSFSISKRLPPRINESNHPGNRRRLVSVLVNCSVFVGCPGGGCVDRSVVLENGVSDES